MGRASQVSLYLSFPTSLPGPRAGGSHTPSPTLLQSRCVQGWVLRARAPCCLSAPRLTNLNTSLLPSQGPGLQGCPPFWQVVEHSVGREEHAGHTLFLFPTSNSGQPKLLRNPDPNTEAAVLRAQT